MRKSTHQTFLFVIIPYVAFTSLWMYFSDLVIASVVTDPVAQGRLEFYLGLTFVCLSVVLLYLLIPRAHTAVADPSVHPENTLKLPHSVIGRSSEGVVSLDRNWRYTYINDSAAAILGRAPGELLGKIIWRESPMATEEPSRQAFEKAMATQQPTIIEDYYPTLGGWFEHHLYPTPQALHIFFHDISARVRALNWRDGQTKVLTHLAVNSPLPETLAAIALAIETQIADVIGSVMLMDVDGQHLRVGAAPHLPTELSQALDGMAIGPARGACGTAAHDKKMIVIEDFETDPRGADFLELSRAYGVRACWSLPVLSASGEVLGTLAMYHRKPRRPTIEERYRIADAGSLMTLAVETTRHRRALNASEARFRATFEQAAVGIAHVAIDGHFLRINRKFCDIIGYNNEEILTVDFQSITHPDDITADLENVERLLTQKISTYSMEKRYLRKDGSVTWVTLTVALLRKEDGTPDYFISVIEDINARKQAEEKLRGINAQLRNLFDHASDAIFVLTSDNRFVDVNQRGLEMFGYTREEFLSLRLADTLVPEERPRLDSEPVAMMAGKLHLAEWTHLRKDGSKFVAEVSAQRVDRHTYQAIVRDTTERHRVKDAP